MSLKNTFKELSWVPSFFSMEIRKILAYRVDFWIRTAGSILIEICISYYLWKSIFEFLNIKELRGYSFSDLIFYYFTIQMVCQIVRGPDWSGFMSREIYDGSLTRFLIYPISYYYSKYLNWLAQGLLGMMQLILGLIVIWLVFDRRFEISNILMGTAIALMANYLFFAISSVLEMISFWMDNVWSLQVMLRFISNFLGGVLVPLSFFPHWFQTWMEYLPFLHLFSLPTLVLLGKVSINQIYFGILSISLWSLLFTCLSFYTWRRGIYQYTGVGI